MSAAYSVPRALGVDRHRLRLLGRDRAAHVAQPGDDRVGVDTGHQQDGGDQTGRQPVPRHPGHQGHEQPHHERRQPHLVGAERRQDPLQVAHAVRRDGSAHGPGDERAGPGAHLDVREHEDQCQGGRVADGLSGAHRQHHVEQRHVLAQDSPREHRPRGAGDRADPQGGDRDPLAGVHPRPRVAPEDRGPDPADQEGRAQLALVELRRGGVVLELAEAGRAEQLERRLRHAGGPALTRVEGVELGVQRGPVLPERPEQEKQADAGAGRDGDQGGATPLALAEAGTARWPAPAARRWSPTTARSR